VSVGDAIARTDGKDMKLTTSFEMHLDAGLANIEATVSTGKTTRGVTHIGLEYVSK